MMLKEQESFLLNVISERDELLEERLVANYTREKEELGTRMDQLEEAFIQNITDESMQLEFNVNNASKQINEIIAIVAKDAKSAVDKVETLEKEIERMEATRLVEKEMVEKMMVEKEMVEEQMRQSERALRVEVNRTVELLGEARKELEKEKILVRQELADMEMQMRKRMEASLIPLRSEVEII